jgi:hypothetical protein
MVLALATGCGQSPTAPGTGGAISVTDSTGDVPATTAVPNPPDLQVTDVKVADGTVTFSVRFASGWAGARTLIDIYVDTDENAGTGLPLDGIGADYDIAAGVALKYTGTVPTVIGSSAVTFLADGADISVPLSLIGNDDGAFDFRVRARDAAQELYDELPDADKAAARVP